MSDTIPNEVVERHARAYDPVGWAWYDNAADDHPAKTIFRERALAQSRAAIAVLNTITHKDGDQVYEIKLILPRAEYPAEIHVTPPGSNTFWYDIITMPELLSIIEHRRGVTRDRW